MKTSYRKRRITWINIAKRSPRLGGEYNVTYLLEDGEYPVTSTFEYDSIRNEWIDPRFPKTVKNHLVLYWSHIPKPPKGINPQLWK